MGDAGGLFEFAGVRASRESLKMTQSHRRQTCRSIVSREVVVGAVVRGNTEVFDLVYPLCPEARKR